MQKHFAQASDELKRSRWFSAFNRQHFQAESETIFVKAREVEKDAISVPGVSSPFLALS